MPDERHRFCLSLCAYVQRKVWPTHVQGVIGPRPYRPYKVKRLLQYFWCEKDSNQKAESCYRFTMNAHDKSNIEISRKNVSYGDSFMQLHNIHLGQICKEEMFFTPTKTCLRLGKTQTEKILSSSFLGIQDLYLIFTIGKDEYVLHFEIQNQWTSIFLKSWSLYIWY